MRLGINAFFIYKLLLYRSDRHSSYVFASPFNIGCVEVLVERWDGACFVVYGLVVYVGTPCVAVSD